MNEFIDITKKNAYVKQRNNMRLVDTYIGYTKPKDMLIADTYAVHIGKFITNFNLDVQKEGNMLLLIDPLSTVGYLIKDENGTCFKFFDRNYNNLYIGGCYFKKDSYHLDGAVISLSDEKSYQVGIFSYLPKAIGEKTNECVIGLTTFELKPKILNLDINNNNFNSRNVLRYINKLYKEIKENDYYEDVTNIDYELIGDISQFVNLIMSKEHKNILK